MKLSFWFASLLFIVCSGAFGGPLDASQLQRSKDSKLSPAVNGHQRDQNGDRQLLPSLISERDIDAVNISSDPASTTTDRTKFYEQPWFDGVIAAVGFIIILTVIIVVSSLIGCCCYFKCKRSWNLLRNEITGSEVEFEDSSEWSSNSREAALQRHRIQKPKRQLGDCDEDDAVHFFLTSNSQSYTLNEKLDDLGSRVQKSWYAVRSVDEGEFKILTVAPVSGSCPLQLHKHQKGLNKLLGAVKVHPFIQPIERVEYLTDYQLLVMVQPHRFDGSLKDLIYRVSHPSIDWSQKYSRRSRGLAPAKVARYGRHILEAMLFLYSKNFPTLGHVQSGNIFVVDDTCLLGGYENTLLGYKTRLFMRCKDHLDRLDIILFGHLIFEMAAGYELNQLRPEIGEIKTVAKPVRSVIEFIFEEGFPHGISEIKAHNFFTTSQPELKDFDPEAVQLSDSMKKVLEKVHKNKPRVQKAPGRPRQPKPTSSIITNGRGNLRANQRGDGLSDTSLSWKDKMPKQIKQMFGQKKQQKLSERCSTGSAASSGRILNQDIVEPLISVKGESY